MPVSRSDSVPTKFLGRRPSAFDGAMRAVWCSLLLAATCSAIAGTGAMLYQSEHPTATGLAETSMFTMQHFMRAQAKEGKVSRSVVDCLDRLPSSELEGVWQAAIERALTPPEIHFVDAFFSSTAGIKVHQLLLAETYRRANETPPFAMPEPRTPEEVSRAREFDKSVAAAKLSNALSDRGDLQLSRSVDARMVELYKQCAASSGLH